MARKEIQHRGPFTLLRSREVYKNPWIRVREDRVIRPDGKPGIFGVVEMLGGVQVVAIDAYGFCYLTREYHYGVAKTTLEVIAGGLEKGETPLQTAKRETFEEAGIKSHQWKSLGMIYPASTVFYSPQHMFLALNAEVLAMPSIEERAVIQIIRVPFSKAVRMVHHKKIRVALSMTAILMADAYFKSVRHVFKKRNE